MSAQLAITRKPEETALPSSDLTKGGTLTVNEVLDAYLKEKFNDCAERVCQHPQAIKYAMVALRAAWGTMTVREFCIGSKARCKAKSEEWRRAEVGAIGIGTCRKRLSILKTAFKYCVEEEILGKALMPTIKLPAGSPARERVLSLEEIAALLRACDLPSTERHLHDYVHLALRTGQRQGAILALRFSEHIDFERKVIRFRDTQARTERSKKRRTDIPMDDALYALLQTIKERADCDAVISFRDKPVKNIWGALKRLYDKAGIVGAHAHDLRRTAATLVGDLKQAAAFIGDTEAVAQRHYYHPPVEDRLPQVQSISKLLADAKSRRA